MTRRVIVSRGINHRDGDLFMDCPDHESIDALTLMALDRHKWRSMVNQLEGKGTHGTVRANTEAETNALIDALPNGSILAFTDGGCDGNGSNGHWGKAGWGAWIARKPNTTEDTTPGLLDLIGCRDIESTILCIAYCIVFKKGKKTRLAYWCQTYYAPYMHMGQKT